VATGTDFAGEVVAVGDGVTRLSVGERVMGFDDENLGSHAEYVLVPEKCPMARVPDGVPFEVAAASLEGAHYAYTFMSAVPLDAGQKVLVYGATGAIGSAAVQLLHAAGVHVTAVCPAEHHGAIRERGAERVFDYQSDAWLRALEGERFPFVLDAVGKSRFGVCRQLLEPRGLYLSSELGPHGANVWLALAAPLMRGQKVRFAIPKNIPRSLEHVVPLLATGKFRPLIDRSYPLEEIRAAFEYVASGQKLGNVLLTPG
jgi:NADPH:quinone reductase-like Zn-dependent oxidoreductase